VTITLGGAASRLVLFKQYQPWNIDGDPAPVVFVETRWWRRQSRDCHCGQHLGA